METTQSIEIIISDGLMTICLGVLGLSLAVLLLGWIIGRCIKSVRTKLFKSVLNCSVAMVLLSGYLAYDHFFFNYYAGYLDTSPIADAPCWIIQFHCYRDYDAQKAEIVQMVSEAMSYYT